jgi:3-mercaptopyruvate sulfurtransferase SseA
MAAVAAMRLGHRNVAVYHGGFPDWQLRGLPIATGAHGAR